MGEQQQQDTDTTITNTSTPTSDDETSDVVQSTIKPHVSLIQPSQKKKHHHYRSRPLRVLRSIFRSFPIISPSCKFPEIAQGGRVGSKITCTLFGYRKGRVSLAMQENPKCLPTLVIELAMQTNVLQKEMSLGMVRIALECEKNVEKVHKIRLLDEPIWTMYCNGKKMGYGVKREAMDDDLNVMELLKAVSMGAGVLPGKSEIEGCDGELAYIRAHFEHVVGSKDSETLYMLSPDANANVDGPELSIFFVRL
ncbi:protein MIZU-KUSSEI 1-like [Silene latifolia]|uniref:protein MIZU-KUSSEI 1-like n=1 Tax=Silene latifolia TaxID=37657 RepID=UPI003D76D469